MADGRLNSVYEFIFKGEDKVSPVVSTIEGQIDSTVRRVKSRFRKELEALVGDASGALSQVASLSGSVKDAFRELETTHSSEALKKASRSVDDYADALERELEALKKLKSHIADQQGGVDDIGVDTHYLDVAIEALEKESNDLASTLSTLYSEHFNSLVDAYKNAGDASERARIQQQLYNDILEVFGEDTEKAKEVYQSFIDSLSQGEGTVSKIGEKFKSFFASVSKWTKGPSVLGGLVGGLVGAVTSVGLSVAINAVTAALQKGIQAITKWVKSWGEVKRAANEGAGAAVAATMSEVQELDRLNGKLKTTDSKTKEYAKTKDELVSKFGKYYDQLGDEISRVGYLADGYDQLRNSILRANLEKQRGAAVEGLEKEYNPGIASSLAKERKAIYQAFADNEGEADRLYRALATSVYTGTDLSAQDQQLINALFGTGGAKSQRRAEKLRRKESDLYNQFTFVEDLSPDYSAREEEIQREQQEEQRQRDVIQRQKEYQYELAQLNVDAMAEGAAKQRAQADLNHRKELDQLDQYKADYIQKASEMYEAAWKAANPLGVYNPDLFWSNQGSPIAGLPTLSGAQTAAESQTSARKQGQEDAYRRELADIAKQTSSRAYQYAEQIKQNNKAVARAVVDAEFENRALRIEAMKDSTAKELAQLKLGHDQEIEQLRRQREDSLKQLQENEKTEWLAGGENRQEYQFKTTITEDSEAFRAQREQFEAQEKLLNEAYQRASSDLLLKYDSLEVQRADLEKKWEQTIAGASDARIKQILEKERNLELAQFDEQAVEQFGTKSQKYKAMKARMDAEVDALVDDTQKKIAQAANDVELTEFLFGDPAAYNNLAQAKEAVTAIYDARIKQAQAEEDVVKEQQLQRELAQQLLELQKQYSAAFALIYADAQKLTTNQLQKAIVATQEAIKEAAGSGDIQALTDLYSRLREQMNVMGDRERGWGFSGMVSGANRLQDADFKRMQAEALSAIDADMFAEEIKRLMEDAINDDEQGWAAINKGAQEVKETLGGIGEMLQSFGDDTEGWAKSLYEVGGFLTGLSSGLDNIETAFNKNASAGDKISVAVSGTIQLFGMVLDSIRANKEAQEEWNRTIDESGHRLAMLRLEALDYKQQNIFGVENPYKKAIDGAVQYSASMEELAKMTAKLNEGQVQTGTKKVVDWSKVGKGAATGVAAGASIGSIIPGIGTAIGAAIGGAIGLIAGAVSRKTVPVFESLQKQYGQLFNPDTYELNEKLIADYDKLDDATKQIVDNWDEIVAKAKEAEEQMRENFSNLAGDIGTQLSDSLVDAFKNGELDGAVDDFHKKMNATIEDIIQQMVFSNVFSGMFDELQKDMEASFRGPNADNNIVDDLIRFEEAYQQGLADYEEQMSDARKYLQSKGYDAWENEDERKAQTRTALGASQDSVDESNARLTTIQGHTYEINENVRKLVAAAGLSAAAGAILPSFPAMEPVAARDYSEDLLRIREELVVLSKNDDRFMAAIAELQSVTEGIRASSQRTSENTDEANAVAARIRSNLETVVDRGVTMR